MPDPDHTIRSRRVYTGRVINLDIDDVTFPDGSSGELEIIRHPGASAILAITGEAGTPDPELVMIRQYRHAAGGYVYEVPAGRLNEGENPEACAARELQEETGYRAGALVPLFTMFTTPGFTDERIHVFRASALRKGEPIREPDEFMSVHLMRLSEALALIRTGQINDAKTALAILYGAQIGTQGHTEPQP
jgi:ADP-ribose diphosphatase